MVGLLENYQFSTLWLHLDTPFKPEELLTDDNYHTVFGNHIKCLVQQSTLRAKRATFHFEWTKVDNECQNVSVMFWKTETCSQTVLPDRSVISRKCQN